MEIKSLREIVIDEMLSDDSYLEKDGVEIKKAYNKAAYMEKALVDKVFILLCGYSLETLIEKHENQTEE
jgi:hypothetical protein